MNIWQRIVNVFTNGYAAVEIEYAETVEKIHALEVNLHLTNNGKEISMTETLMPVLALKPTDGSIGTLVIPAVGTTASVPPVADALTSAKANLEASLANLTELKASREVLAKQLAELDADIDAGKATHGTLAAAFDAALTDFRALIAIA